MAVKLKDIPGVLVEKYHVMPDLICKDCVLSARESHREGFNQGIESQGNISITLNRERLAKEIYEDMRESFFESIHPINHYPEWEFADERWRKTSYRQADRIIKSQKDLLERGEE